MRAALEHVVFLLEEESPKDFLVNFVPRVIPPTIQTHFMVFEGKQDLERQLPRKLSGWIRPHTRFIVLRDQDSADCLAVKARLKKICANAGKKETIVRIACRELETFFLGDWQGLAEAFQQPKLAQNTRLAKFRNPDLLGSPSLELKKIIPAYGKRDGARRMARALDPARNCSRSFQVLYQSIQSLSH